MRHAQFASAALTLAVLLASCGQQPTVSPSTSSSQNSGQTNLSTQSAAEKFRQFRAKVYEEKNPVLLAKIQKLPERMRKNVIFIDGERMYSNNSQLLKEMQQFKQLEGERWVDEQGQSTQMPAFAPTPASLSGSGTLGAQATNVRCKTDNSGPFSRVLTYPGYSWFIGDVTLPDSYNAQQATGDSVHLYTGGWSTSAAVDGGYQRNADGRYQAILRATYTGYSGYAAATPHHFRAGRGNLEFFTFRAQG